MPNQDNEQPIAGAYDGQADRVERGTEIYFFNEQRTRKQAGVVVVPAYEFKGAIRIKIGAEEIVTTRDRVRNKQKFDLEEKARVSAEYYENTRVEAMKRLMPAIEAYNEGHKTPASLAVALSVGKMRAVKMIGEMRKRKFVT